MKLPAQLFVRWEVSANSDPWLVAGKTLSSVMEDDGPCDIGVYMLVETKQAQKFVTVKTKRVKK